VTVGTDIKSRRNHPIARHLGAIASTFPLWRSRKKDRPQAVSVTRLSLV
jgi:hypothetical protein